jgi:hypothetical protein
MVRPLVSSLAVLLVLASASQACTTSEDPASGGTDAGADTATSSDASRPDGSSQDSSTDSAAADADATTDGGSDAGACLSGGTVVTVTGSGTCAAPYVVDLSGAALGSVASYVATGGTDQSTPLTGASCKVSFTATARDVVFHVKMPNSVASLDVSAVPSASGDTRIAVAEDPSCGQPLNACADATGTGACDFVNAPRGGFGFFGTETYVVVSEVTSSGQPITVYFRAN